MKLIIKHTENKINIEKVTWVTSEGTERYIAFDESKGCIDLSQIKDLPIDVKLEVHHYEIDGNVTVVNAIYNGIVLETDVPCIQYTTVSTE